MAKLYVGNLNFQTTEEELKQVFSEVGVPTRATVVRDKFTNQSRGFAFVEFETRTSRTRRSRRSTAAWSVAAL